jgi:hypothetical protein
MVDAVDSLLNNAVDLYVLQPDFDKPDSDSGLRWNLTNKVGIRRRPADIAGFWGYRSRFRPD